MHDHTYKGLKQLAVMKISNMILRYCMAYHHYNVYFIMSLVFFWLIMKIAPPLNLSTPPPPLSKSIPGNQDSFRPSKETTNVNKLQQACNFIKLQHVCQDQASCNLSFADLLQLVVTSCCKPWEHILISACCNKLLQDVNRLVTSVYVDFISSIPHE